MMDAKSPHGLTDFALLQNIKMKASITFVLLKEANQVIQILQLANWEDPITVK